MSTETMLRCKHTGQTFPMDVLGKEDALKHVQGLLEGVQSHWSALCDAIVSENRDSAEREIKSLDTYSQITGIKFSNVIRFKLWCRECGMTIHNDRATRCPYGHEAYKHPKEQGMPLNYYCPKCKKNEHHYLLDAIECCASDWVFDTHFEYVCNDTVVAFNQGDFASQFTQWFCGLFYDQNAAQKDERIRCPLCKKDMFSIDCAGTHVHYRNCEAMFDMLVKQAIAEHRDIVQYDKIASPIRFEVLEVVSGRRFETERTCEVEFNVHSKDLKLFANRGVPVVYLPRSTIGNHWCYPAPIKLPNKEDFLQLQRLFGVGMNDGSILVKHTALTQLEGEGFSAWFKYFLKNLDQYNCDTFCFTQS